MSNDKEQNNIVFLVAVVAIVGSAFVSGMVVYRWQKAKLNRALTSVASGGRLSSPSTSNITPSATGATSNPAGKTSNSATPTTSTGNTTANVPASSNSTVPSSSSAKSVLENFFKYLSEGNFDKAAENYQYDETEGALSVFADYMDSYKMANTLRNFCEVQSTCLAVRIIGQEEIEDGYQFKVNFIKSDGSTYRYEIGGTISEEAFDYKVKLFHGQYRVVTPPLFHP